MARMKGAAADHAPPKPNTQALSWFYGEYKKDTLQLTPKYQRNPIWSIGQKCFLIDSIISGVPIPQVFINIKSVGRGRDRQTIYEVVDGQQRLRAILEFMSDQYTLVKTTVKSYPVSSVYPPQIGRTYSALSGSLQEAIWNYPLAVQELRGWSDERIRALFRRLNYVVERLNSQELRHSQYFGLFVEAVEDLTSNEFWDDIGLFTRRDSQRMKDVEFVSELFVILIDGVQEGQDTLDGFYAKYDVDFPRRAHYVGKFKQNVASLRTIQDFLSRSRFKKKADFYGLFAAAARLNERCKRPIDLAGSVEALEKLQSDLTRPRESLRGVGARYYGTVIEGPAKRPKREERTAILEEILSQAL